MREFKFRFWSHRDKKMFYSGIYDLDTVGAEDISFLDDEDEYNWIVMQCTGLEDKNVKEIYEGDIISGNSAYRRKVIYCDSRGAFILEDIRGYTYFVWNGLVEYEVLGNIYENPELLEGAE